MAYRIFTVMLFLMAVAILQWHAIAFWQTHTGSLGWMWALGIEGAAVWLWWQPQRLVRMIGLVASVLSLVGPLYHVGSPAIESIERAEFAELERLNRMDVLRGTLEKEQESLRQYQSLAGKRTGWSGRIDRTQVRIDKTREELRTLMSEIPAGGVSLGLVVIGMEVLALIVLQVVVVLAVRSLATPGQAAEVTEGLVNEEPIALEPPATTEATKEPLQVPLCAETIPERLQRQLDGSGENVSAWARRQGLNPDRVRQVLAGRASHEVEQAVGEVLSR